MPELFFERMLQDSDVLSRDAYLGYKQAFEFYRESTVNDKVATNFLIKIELLLDYLITHEIDPDNSLIGLTISPSVVEEFGIFHKSSSRMFDDSTRDLCEKLISKENLHSKILEWTKLSEDAIKAQVVEIANVVRRMTSTGLAKGTLLLLREPNRITFARFQCRMDEKILVYVQPDEKKTSVVSPEDIRLLPKKLKERIEKLRTREKLVLNPIQDFLSALYVQVEKLVLNFLRDQNVDMNFLSRLDDSNEEDRQFLILNVDTLKKLAVRLETLSLDQSTGLLSTLEGLYSSNCKDFLKDFDVAMLFPTQRRDSLHQLRSGALSSYARGFFKEHQKRCEEAFDRIERLIESIRNGDKKNELTSWWLKLIFHRANDFLSKKNYCFDAVPEDYIETRPESTEKVRANLKLLKEILDPRRDVHDVRKFVSQLKDEIYPKVEEYLVLAKLVLCQKLRQDPKTLNFPLLELAFKSNQHLFEQTTAGWLLNLINDIKYINEMKEMEDMADFEQAMGEVSNRLVMSSVVPISGLIMGHFHILENIVKTVMEVWGIPTEEVEATPIVRVSRQVRKSCLLPMNNLHLGVGASGTPLEDEEEDDETDFLNFLRNTRPPGSEPPPSFTFSSSNPRDSTLMNNNNNSNNNANNNKPRKKASSLLTARAKFNSVASMSFSSSSFSHKSTQLRSKTTSAASLNPPATSSPSTPSSSPAPSTSNSPLSPRANGGAPQFPISAASNNKPRSSINPPSLQPSPTSTNLTNSPNSVRGHQHHLLESIPTLNVPEPGHLSPISTPPTLGNMARPKPTRTQTYNHPAPVPETVTPSPPPRSGSDPNVDKNQRRSKVFRASGLWSPPTETDLLSPLNKPPS
eukprot:TRINITY_DN10223_c0_g1_i1.p1 TRINITY_DN10223_c0_g1~~TRINITY_DN10223_c0_g1_i1.p1  ORF type:complete len:935 (-),score=229.64 TRINITY_DN10223_c0_g1_i1:2103-4679(-)